MWETRHIASSSPITVVNNDVTSHLTNPLDPVFSPVFGICSGVRHCHVCTSELSGKNARLPDFYCFLGVSIHDCRDSQPSSGCLRKVGVLMFCRPSRQVQGVGGRDPESRCAAARPARQARRTAAALPQPAGGVCPVKSVFGGLSRRAEITDRNKNPPVTGDFYFLNWER